MRSPPGSQNSATTLLPGLGAVAILAGGIGIASSQLAAWGGLGIAAVVGAEAGVYPAVRAARLSPTGTLRSE